MKTADLIDAALDWAVAKCVGELTRADYYLHESTGAFMLEQHEVSVLYSPSTNGAQGVPIIESMKEKGHSFCLFYSPYDHAAYGRKRPWSAEFRGRIFYAETLLIAAMRCYVYSELGEEVEVPEELR